MPAKKGYWIKFHIGECPICGNNASYKERMYDVSKPPKQEDRYVGMSYEECYDQCDIQL